MFWYNKKHPNTIYIDIEQKKEGHIKGKLHSVTPDIIMDFRDLKFPDNSFKLIVWDPPHKVKLAKTSKLGKYYGSLNAETWPGDLKRGFKECWRVLEDYGVLIFKWNENEISLDKVLRLFPKIPLFGHPRYSNEKTHWLCFMKIPEG